jgi:hypothetical protein
MSLVVSEPRRWERGPALRDQPQSAVAASLCRRSPQNSPLVKRPKIAYWSAGVGAYEPNLSFELYVARAF